MATKQQLSLVTDAQEPRPVPDAVRRVFEHWVFMMGKSVRRCALGPSRRKVLTSALAMYDEDTLMLAVEGCAASAWHAGENERGLAYNDLELILRDEKHIEKFAEDGERLRARAAAALASAAVEMAPEDPDAAQRARDHLRAIARRLSGRHTS